MTGQHMGHTHVRGNAGGDMSRQSLRNQDLTVAEKLKEAGYATALIGKWGLGEVGQEGHPLKQGFDYLYGYLNQVHAHNFYPEFLWRSEKKHMLSNVVQRVEKKKYGGFVGGAATKKVEYSHDLFANEAIAWIEKNKNNPFFLYLPLLFRTPTKEPVFLETGPRFRIMESIKTRIGPIRIRTSCDDYPHG